MATAAGDARDAVLTLLSARAQGATICPSEAARRLAADAGAADEWRAMMPAVHAAVDLLLAEGLIALGWKGRPLPSRAGPYRIGVARPT